MIYSMTGYGKAVCDFANLKLSIEIKSLNSKQLDLNCKVPFDLRQKEYEIRSKLATSLIRGKIDCLFLLEMDTADGQANINQHLFDVFFEQIKALSKKHNLEVTDRLFLAALKMPDVIASPKIEINDTTWPLIEHSLDSAIDQCLEFRKQEGICIEKDLTLRATNILNLLVQVLPYENQRIKVIRERIKENMNEWIDKKNVDENRFEQEMIYYLEKLDISEEKSRLKNHCGYFIETLQEPGGMGKKLNFISQEMGREINTLGSKASDTDIQKIVVQMKDELEKIKEQVLNVV
jgi:uncharacterized protein (TIGR00255 family)